MKISNETLPQYDGWNIVKKIGSGAFGAVYEMERKVFVSDHVHKSALKKIAVPASESEIINVFHSGMTEDDVREYFKGMALEIVNELELMYKLRGVTNIVSYEDHIIKQQDNGVGWDVLIRMELLTSLPELEKSKPFTKKDIICLGIGICTALERCMNLNIIHRDLKPENIFISEQGDYKLGDFGIARTIEKNNMSDMSRKGTYNYMAPEVYLGKKYGYSVDQYSLGLVMYRLLNHNRMPFLPSYPNKIKYKDQEAALLKRMQGQQLPYPSYDQSELADIILKACSYNPEDRYQSPTHMKEDLIKLLNQYNSGESLQYNSSETLPLFDMSVTDSKYFTGNQRYSNDNDLTSSNLSYEKKKKDTVLDISELDDKTQIMPQDSLMDKTVQDTSAINIGNVYDKKKSENNNPEYFHLGNDALKNKDYKKALEYYQLYLNTDLDYFDDNNSNKALVYYNMAYIYSQNKDYVNALNYDEKALEIRMKLIGENHLDTANSYNNIAYNYAMQNNYPKALEYDQKALSIREKLLGKNHTDVASSYENLGDDYLKIGNKKNAVNYYEKAIEIRKNCSDNYNLGNVVSYHNLACYYGEMGDNDKALFYFNEVISIYNNLRYDNLDASITYEMMANIYKNMNDYDSMIHNQLEALKVQMTILGKDDIQTQNSINQIRESFEHVNKKNKKLYNKQLMQIINNN